MLAVVPLQPGKRVAISVLGDVVTIVSFGSLTQSYLMAAKLLVGVHNVAIPLFFE
jgi:hypothetical protein